MSEDKNLIITKSGNTYEDENNAETIKILVPRQINGNDLGECIIHLCVLNQDNLGDEINISKCLQDYGDNLYVANIDITNKITYKTGEIQLWIKILNSDNQMVAKTNPVTYQIKEHFDIKDYIPESKLSLLDDFSIRMEDAVDAAEEAVSKPPLASDNGNWYVWDASIGDYKDSGIPINIDLTGYVKEDDLNNTLELAIDYTNKEIEKTKSYVDSEIAKFEVGGGGAVDQEYNPASENAQSGKAVAQAMAKIPTGGGDIVFSELANFTLKEEVNDITVPLSDDAFNYRSILIVIDTQTKATGQYWMYLGNIENMKNTKKNISHMNGALDGPKHATYTMIDFFKNYCFSSAVDTADYQYNSTYRGYMYPIIYKSFVANAIYVASMTFPAGTTIIVEGVM